MSIIRRTFSDKILIISFICALLGIFIGKPVLKDISFSTIETLFSLMVCVQLLNSFHILDNLSYFLITNSHDTKQMNQFFIFLSFISSMFLTNDVAILTLIPIFLNIANKQKLKIAYPITLMVIAANLGSSFTPIGNPQNLFLINYYHTNIANFFKLSTPLAIISIILLLILSNFFPKNKFSTNQNDPNKLQINHLFIAASLTILIFLGIFSIIPITIVALITSITGILINKNIYKHIDYALLLTFICFFIFASELSHNTDITNLINKFTKSSNSVYITGIITSQLISNVPTTILLSQFTNRLPALFFGVNIGGLGSIISSLANLLALKQIILLSEHSQSKNFFKVFTLINLICLFVLIIFGFIYLLII